GKSKATRPEPGKNDVEKETPTGRAKHTRMQTKAVVPEEVAGKLRTVHRSRTSGTMQQ
ncbi:hypothetical protein KI387_025171, partial [Taxus chinensis]